MSRARARVLAAIEASVAPNGRDEVADGGGIEGLDVRGLCGMAGAADMAIEG